MAENSMDTRRTLPAAREHAAPHAVDPRRIIQTPLLVAIVYEANYGCGRSTWTAAPRRITTRTMVVWLFEGPLGWRHARRRDHELPRWRVARHQWQPADRCREGDRALRRPNYGTLEIEVTVDDPKAYTRPWTVTTRSGSWWTRKCWSSYASRTRRARSTSGQIDVTKCPPSARPLALTEPLTRHVHRFSGSLPSEPRSS